MDEQRRQKLLNESALGRAILEEEAGESMPAMISPQRRRLLEATHWGRAVLTEHDARMRQG